MACLVVGRDRGRNRRRHQGFRLRISGDLDDWSDKLAVGASMLVFDSLQLWMKEWRSVTSAALTEGEDALASRLDAGDALAQWVERPTWRGPNGGNSAPLDRRRREEGLTLRMSCRAQRDHSMISEEIAPPTPALPLVSRRYSPQTPPRANSPEVAPSSRTKKHSGELCSMVMAQRDVLRASVGQRKNGC
jgi:hypothetical protein